MDNYSCVVCPICNKQLKVITKTHFKIHGYMTKEDFLKDYPNTLLVSEEYRVRNAELRRQIFINLNQSLEQRNKSSQRAKIRNSNSDFQREMQSRRKYSQEERDKISQSLKKAYQEGRKVYTPNYGKKHLYSIDENKTLVLRSFLECKVCKFLLINNFEFEYESLKIPYYSSEECKTRQYIPDFYLPQYNLIIEVKPKEKQNLLISIDKREASIKEGYNFIYIKSEDLDDYESLLNKIYALDTK